jgi:hypothetical protein
MDKFYQAYPLLIKIITARLLSTYLNIKLEHLSKYIAKVAPEIYIQLPSIILKTYENVWGFKYDVPGKQYRGVADIYGTLYLGMKDILNETMMKVNPQVSIEEFSAILEAEARRRKKISEQSPGYRLLSTGR